MTLSTTASSATGTNKSKTKHEAVDSKSVTSNGSVRTPIVNGTLVPVKFADDGNLMEVEVHPKVEKPEKTYDSTLPSSVAIPVGLAQVILGLAMIICGSLAFRHRSYLCYYGSGLWTGIISGVTGALLATSTKREFLRLNWFLRGGKKWKIHFIVSSAILSLVTSVLMALFSMWSILHEQDSVSEATVTVRNEQTDAEKTLLQVEELFASRQATSAAINAFLLVLSALEILLSFCTIGITLRVLCRSMGTSSILFPSDPEPQNNRLIRWLGNHRYSSSPRPKTISQTSQASIISIAPIRRKKVKPEQMPQIVPVPTTMPLQYQYPIVPVSYGYPVPIPITYCPSIYESIGGTMEPCPVHGSEHSGSMRSTNQSHRKSESNEENISQVYSAIDNAVAKSFCAKSKIKF